jgi:hypothetical protein
VFVDEQRAKLPARQTIAFEHKHTALAPESWLEISAGNLNPTLLDYRRHASIEPRCKRSNPKEGIALKFGCS